MATTTASLDDLPEEIIQQVLLYVTPTDTLSIVQFISKRLNRLGNEQLLWRYYCCTSFKYWDSKHRIDLKISSSVSDVDWKKIYFYRRNVDLQTTKTLDSMLQAQTKRIEKYEMISQYGYDSKDTLLRHCNTDDNAEDVLARRYYSNSVLDHVHRSKALEEWWKLGKGEDVVLERALGSFDMFVLHDQHGDLEEISELFNIIVSQLRAEQPNVDSLSPRGKALTVVRYLRSNNLTGLASELQYRDLQNNYIGIALQDEDHPSLPLISVAIFCAVAQRLGLEAHPCAFPNHVHAVVYFGGGQSPDRQAFSTDTTVLPMYLDPYRSDAEVPVEHLRTQLVAWGVNASEFSRFLGVSSTRTIVLRTSRNILATVHEVGGLDVRTHNRLQANSFANMDSAFYSALWANFMLCGPSERLQFLPLIVERFQRLHEMDAGLIDRYVVPPFRDIAPGDQLELFDALRVVRAGDSIPKQVRSRHSLTQGNTVKYRVGQVFQHRRYGYTAVIIGWDVECEQNSQWMAQNRIEDLDRGRHQSFYNALVEDSSIRYVAEENLEIIEPEIPISLMSLAGKYFKRWDRDAHRFVSNITDEYPDN